MTSEKDELGRKLDRLVGYALMAIGGLVAGLGGLCTVGVLGSAALDAFRAQNPTPALLTGAFALIGLVPVWIGYYLIQAGREVGRRD